MIGCKLVSDIDWNIMVDQIGTANEWFQSLGNFLWIKYASEKFHFAVMEDLKFGTEDVALSLSKPVCLFLPFCA